MTLAEFSFQTAVPYPTAQRWVRRWAELGVAGVRRVRRPGKGRVWIYELDADVPQLWRAGLLPPTKKEPLGRGLGFGRKAPPRS